MSHAVDLEAEVEIGYEDQRVSGPRQASVTNCMVELRRVTRQIGKKLGFHIE